MPPSREWFRAGFFAALGAALLGLLALAVWHVSDATLAIATPFVVGLMLALLLDPLADRLERRGLRRMGAVGIVFGIFLLLLVGFFSIVVPALIDQAGTTQGQRPAGAQPTSPPPSTSGCPTTTSSSASRCRRTWTL